MLNDLAALFSEHAAGFAAAAFALGLVIGSFLNVVIYRLPIMLEREWRAQAVELLPAGIGVLRPVTTTRVTLARSWERESVEPVVDAGSRYR